MSWGVMVAICAVVEVICAFRRWIFVWRVDCEGERLVWGGYGVGKGRRVRGADYFLRSLDVGWCGVWSGFRGWEKGRGGRVWSGRR